MKKCCSGIESESSMRPCVNEDSISSFTTSLQMFIRLLLSILTGSRSEIHFGTHGIALKVFLPWWAQNRISDFSLPRSRSMYVLCFVLVVNTTCDWLTSLNKIPVKKEGKNYNSQNTLIRKQTITEWCVRRKESSRQERFDARSTFLNRRRGQTACAAVACAGFRQELRTVRQTLLSHWLLVGLGEFLQTQPITVNRYAEVAQIYCVFSSHSIGHHIVPEWPKLYIGRAILTFLTR